MTAPAAVRPPSSSPSPSRPVGTRPAPPPARLLLVALVLAAPVLAGPVLAAPAAHAAPDAGRATAAPPVVSATAVPAAAPEPAADGSWSWPLDGRPQVARPFSAPAERWSPGHRGVDLVSSEGASVLSPAAGRVVVARRVVDRGVVVVEHEGGLRTTLEPVEQVPAVGTTVARGDVVGRLAAEGAHCPGCLHWGVRRGDGRDAVYLDPLTLLAPPAPPVLLPLLPTLFRAGPP